MRAPTPQSSMQDANGADYRYEETRLRSYDDAWPMSAPVRASHLAAAGLYFTGHVDRARCFECRVEICHWQPGDEPAREHRRWSRRCRFARGLPCGNVPIVEPAVGPDVCGNV